jgi:tRNA-dihydrouridine synthase
MAYNSDGEELPADWFILKKQGGEGLQQKTYPDIYKYEEKRKTTKFENQPHIRRAKMEHLEMISKRTQEEEEKRRKAESHHLSYLTQMREAKDKRRKAKQVNDMEEFAYWNSRVKSIEEEDRVWRIINT